jgi:hypothetical protein
MATTSLRRRLAAEAIGTGVLTAAVVATGLYPGTAERLRRRLLLSQLYTRVGSPQCEAAYRAVDDTGRGDGWSVMVRGLVRALGAVSGFTSGPTGRSRRMPP